MEITPEPTEPLGERLGEIRGRPWANGLSVGPGASMARGMIVRLALAPVLAVVSLSAFGCGSSSANRPLPSYAGHATDLFDDAVEPKAVGLLVDEPADPRSDSILRERAQLSDAILRVRVTTVTAKHDGSDTSYQLGLRTVENLGGPFPPDDPFTVTMGPRSASLGIVKNLEDAIVGKSFVAFVRAFVLPDGDRELHFHFAPDNKPVATAVRAAMTKKE